MTTQKAPLERFLANQRIKKVRYYAYGRRVVDFGCGLEAWAANELQKHCVSIIGIEPASNVNEINGIQIRPREALVN